jgi:outer membrane PBP1 activator LpoA protein
MRIQRVAVIGLLLSICLAGCAITGGSHTPPPSSAAQDAQALYIKGQFEQAAQAYLNLATQSDTYRDYYRLLAAEAYRQEGFIGRSAQTLTQVNRRNLEGDDVIRYDLLKAEIALKNNDSATALSLTSHNYNQLAPPLQARLLELRAQAQAAGGDVWASVQTRIGMDAQLKGLDREQNRKQIVDSLAGLGKDALAQRAAALPANDPLAPWIVQAQTQLGVALAQAPAVLDQPVGTIGAGGNGNVREGYKVPAKVAILLPSSGPQGAAGAAIREGFFAAYMEAGRNNAPRPLVRVYDAGNDAQHGVDAYDKAVADGNQFVVGPLSREAVSAIFAKGQLPVPMLTLNYSSEKALPPAAASQFGLMPESEGAQVADHMVDRGLTSALVVVSTDDFAKRAGKAFKAEFEARGGHVDNMVSLESAAINYADQIRGTGDGATEKSGIFISMKPQQARLLLPQLRLARNAQPVFGTSHIYAGTDDAAADRDLEGVEFCDAPWLFDAQPGLPRRSDLNADLPATRGVTARLFAFGMDAWGLVPYIDWLRAHSGSYVPGATGQLVADQFGRVRRVLIWARFQDGVAHPVAGSLEMEAPAAASALDGSGADN